MLACVAGLADGPAPGSEHSVMFSSRGGIITPEAQTHISLPSDPSLLIEFDRKCHVYVMDVWVEAGKAIGKSRTDVTLFHRQATRR